MHQHIRPIPLFLSLLLFSVVLIFFPFSSIRSDSKTRSIIWEAPRVFEWKPCGWWKDDRGSLEALPEKNNGYIRIDCYGGLNQMRRDVCFATELG